MSLQEKVQRQRDQMEARIAAIQRDVAPEDQAAAIAAVHPRFLQRLVPHVPPDTNSLIHLFQLISNNYV